MTDDSSTESDTNGSQFRRSRRTLVQLLGSAIAMGAITGSVAGNGDANDSKCGSTGHDDEQGDRFDVIGLSLTDDEFHLERLQFAPIIDGRTTELFDLEGFEATVTDGTVTEMNVASIEIHEDLKEVMMAVVGYLADGGGLDGSGTPNAVHAYLEKIDSRQFERLQTYLENEGGTNALEHRLQNGVTMDADSGGYAGGFVLILVLFILLVIIGAGFGVGGPSEADW